ncbi:MAG: pilus assembly protein [Alphaproteobacteria bacterium]|nr:pilus assembly protein [Alphaproteobacteria bacterium]
MSLSYFKKACRQLGNSLKRAIHNRDGIAAVEFGYIAPVMLLMLVGSVEASRAISIDRRFSSITSMVGDLVSREQEIGVNSAENITKLTAIMKAVEHVMKPHPFDTLELEVIPVMGFGDGTDTKLYAPSYKYSGGSVATARARCEAYTLPAGLVAPGGSVIVVEAKYTYVPATYATWLFGTSHDWEDKATHSPRHSCVDFEDNNCVVTC